MGRRKNKQTNKNPETLGQRKLRSNRTWNFCTPEKEATFCIVLMDEVRKKMPKDFVEAKGTSFCSKAAKILGQSDQARVVLSYAGDSQKSQTTPSHKQFTLLRAENRLW